MTNGFVDTHCHCLPGVDDGPADRQQAMELCRALVEDGVGAVVATPHCYGRFGDPKERAPIRQMVTDLSESLAIEGIELDVLPGAEVRLDERILASMDCIGDLTLAGCGVHLLLELPETVAIDLTPLACRLRRQGVSVILAHPERYQLLVGRPHVLKQWAAAGIALQVTAAALLGEGYMGAQVRKAAWRLVESGLPCVVATDAHDTDLRAPRMLPAHAKLSGVFGRRIADLYCCENPRRILEGVPLLGPEAAEQDMESG